MGCRNTILKALISTAGGLLLTSPSLAAPSCTAVGVPVGCVGRPAVRAATPGVGVQPAAGPGAGPNAGGPVNRPGRR